MKTQKITRMLRFCLPVIMLPAYSGTALYAQEIAAPLSYVVLEKSEQTDTAINPAVSRGEISTKSKRFAWKAQPLPKVKSFLITDFGISYNLLAYNNSKPSENIYLSEDLGFMVNQNERSARGLALFFAATGFDQGTTIRTGLKAKFRRWLGQKSSLDLSPGLVYNLWSDGPLRTPGALGISGQVGLNFSWLGLTGLLEVIPGGRTEYRSKKKTDVSFYAGIRMGERQGATIVKECAVVVFTIAEAMGELLDGILGS